MAASTVGPTTRQSIQSASASSRCRRRRRVWSFVHLDDAAAATVLAVERGAPGVYNVVDDDAGSGAWSGSRLSPPRSAPKPPRKVPRWLARLSRRGRHRADGGEPRRLERKAKRRLGWSAPLPELAAGLPRLLRARRGAGGVTHLICRSGGLPSGRAEARGPAPDAPGGAAGRPVPSSCSPGSSGPTTCARRSRSGSPSSSRSASRSTSSLGALGRPPSPTPRPRPAGDRPRALRLPRLAEDEEDERGLGSRRTRASGRRSAASSSDWA